MLQVRRSARLWLLWPSLLVLSQLFPDDLQLCGAFKPSDKPALPQPLVRKATNVRFSAPYRAMSPKPLDVIHGIPREPRRELLPPFPNGPCGGTILEIAPEETFGVDVNLANINILGDWIVLPRPIKVWLPPGYGENRYKTKIRHPVLYTHDGQNVMEDAESWTGASWRLMGALTRLADHELLKKGQPLPIVVLIPSASGDLLPGVRRRHLEYGDINVPFSQAYGDFVAQTLKPLVDNRFDTNPEPEATFAIGSSLGGQASLHLLLRHGDKFGGAACLSPAFGPAILEQVRKSGDTLRGKLIYLDIGGDLDEIRVPIIDFFDHMTPEHWWNPGYFWLDTQLQGQVRSMKEALTQVGVSYHFCEYPGGRHNERAWSQRIDMPIKFFFGATKKEEN